MQRFAYFDATFLAFGADGRGIPQVIRQWIDLILGRADFDAVRFFTTPGAADGSLSAWGVPASRIDRVAPPPGPWARERFHGAFAGWRCRRLKRLAAAWIHPEVRGVFPTPLPRLVMHHDFIAFHANSVQGPWKPFRRQWYAYKNRLAARGCSDSMHIANSSHTAQEAVDFFPEYAACRFRVLPLGGRFPVLPAGHRKPPPSADGEPLEFLYVGAYEDRKNVPALIASLPRLHPARRLRLTLIGRASPDQESRLRQVASALPQRCEIRCLGQVDDLALAEAYRRAHFFTTASLFEGFGLPLVEAMAQGVPVLAFANSAIPETLGEAGFAVPDGDFGAWGRRVEAAVADPDLYRRWSEAGRLRAAEYTDAAMKSRYAAALEEFLAKVLPK